MYTACMSPVVHVYVSIIPTHRIVLFVQFQSSFTHFVPCSFFVHTAIIIPLSLIVACFSTLSLCEQQQQQQVAQIITPASSTCTSKCVCVFLSFFLFPFLCPQQAPIRFYPIPFLFKSLSDIHNKQYRRYYSITSSFHCLIQSVQKHTHTHTGTTT